jgi:hypothetical protein
MMIGIVLSFFYCSPRGANPNEFPRIAIIVLFCVVSFLADSLPSRLRFWGVDPDGPSDRRFVAIQ